MRNLTQNTRHGFYRQDSVIMARLVMVIVIFCLVFGDYVKAYWTLQTLLLPEITREAISKPNVLKQKLIQQYNAHRGDEQMEVLLKNNCLYLYCSC